MSHQFSAESCLSPHSSFHPESLAHPNQLNHYNSTDSPLHPYSQTADPTASTPPPPDSSPRASTPVSPHAASPSHHVSGAARIQTTQNDSVPSIKSQHYHLLAIIRFVVGLIIRRSCYPKTRCSRDAGGTAPAARRLLRLVGRDRL